MAHALYRCRNADWKYLCYHTFLEAFITYNILNAYFWNLHKTRIQPTQVVLLPKLIVLGKNTVAEYLKRSFVLVKLNDELILPYIIKY